MIVPVAIRLSPLTDIAEHIVITTIRDVGDRERRSREDILLAELGALAGAENDTDSLYQLLESTLSTLIKFDRIVITAKHSELGELERLFVSGLEVPGNEIGTRIPIPKEFSSSAKALGSIQHVVSQEALDDPNSSAGRHAEAGLKSWLRVPLGDADNPYGDLSLRSTEANAYDDDDLGILSRVASRISSALENARLYKQVQEEAHIRTILAEISKAVSSSPDVSEFFDQFAELSKKLIPFDAMVYSDVDVSQGVIKLKYWHGYDLSVGNAYEGVELEGTIAETAIAKRTGVLLAANAGKPVSDHTAKVPSAIDDDLSETICVPLFSRGAPIGCLYLASVKPGALTQSHVELASMIGDQISGSIASVDLVDRLRTESELREALAEVSRVSNEDLSMSHIYQTAADLLKKLIDYDRMVVTTVCDD